MIPHSKLCQMTGSASITELHTMDLRFLSPLYCELLEVWEFSRFLLVNKFYFLNMDYSQLIVDCWLPTQQPFSSVLPCHLNFVYMSSTSLVEPWNLGEIDPTRASCIDLGGLK